MRACCCVRRVYWPPGMVAWQSSSLAFVPAPQLAAGFPGSPAPLPSRRSSACGFLVEVAGAGEMGRSGWGLGEACTAPLQRSTGPRVLGLLPPHPPASGGQGWGRCCPQPKLEHVADCGPPCVCVCGVCRCGCAGPASSLPLGPRFHRRGSLPKSLAGCLSWGFLLSPHLSRRPQPVRDVGQRP